MQFLLKFKQDFFKYTQDYFKKYIKHIWKNIWKSKGTRVDKTILKNKINEKDQPTQFPDLLYSYRNPNNVGLTEW